MILRSVVGSNPAIIAGSTTAINRISERCLSAVACDSLASIAPCEQQSIEQPDATIPLAIGQSGPMPAIAIGQPVVQTAFWPTTQNEAASAGCTTRRTIARTAAKCAIRFIGCFDFIELGRIGQCARSHRNREARRALLLAGRQRFHRNQHVFLAHHQIGGVQRGELKTVAVGNGIGRTSFNAVSAEDAAVVVDVVDLGVALR
jgi:hypothetical protein